MTRFHSAVALATFGFVTASFAFYLRHQIGFIETVLAVVVGQ